MPYHENRFIFHETCDRYIYEYAECEWDLKCLGYVERRVKIVKFVETREHCHASSDSRIFTFDYGKWTAFMFKANFTRAIKSLHLLNDPRTNEIK